MSALLESFVALALAGAGAAAGLALSRLRRPWWVLAYVLPLAVVLAVRLVTLVPSASTLPLLEGLSGGVARYWAMSLAVPMMFASLLRRLDSPRKKALVVALACAAVVLHGVGPLVGTVLCGDRLLKLGTRTDGAGVCLQQTAYTCGPAAAATALRRLGLDADEGEIAVAARTSPTNGTQPGDLCRALEARYSGDGLTCEYAGFSFVADLHGKCPVLVVVKLVPLIDHWVAVLEVTDSEVVCGDPAKGLVRVPHEGFARGWRRRGIVLRREGTERAGGDP
ncbi:MAG: cysteine peptidase family C39 domain-containing protein [Planctomycetota bacterium]|jgi:predicted double-glycine peptidase